MISIEDSILSRWAAAEADGAFWRSSGWLLLSLLIVLCALPFAALLCLWPKGKGRGDEQDSQSI